MAVVFEELWPGSNGAAWDSGRWPTRDQGPNVVVDIQSTRGRVLLNDAAGAVRALAWALGGHDAVTDFDLLLDWTPANTVPFRLGIIFGRTSNTAGNMLYIRPFSGTNGQIRLNNGINLNTDVDDDVAEVAAGTELINQAVTFSSPTTNRYACRVQREGSALRCRVWVHGTSEPGTWHIDTTLTANPTGTVGLVSMAHNADGSDPDIRWGPITLDDGEEDEPVEVVVDSASHAHAASQPTVTPQVDPTIPATVPGTDTSDLVDPADRAGKSQRWAWWTGTRWDAVLPTSSGWRLYTDLTGGMDSGAVVDSRQAARVDVLFHDGSLWVLRGHTSEPQITRYDHAAGVYTADGDVTSVGIAALTASNGDASPAVLYRTPNGRLWAAVNNGSNVVVAISDNGGESWSSANVISVSETGVVMLAHTGTTLVLLSTQNAGGGRHVRTIAQDAGSITSGNWGSENLPALPGGIVSDDHGMMVAVEGHLYATSKTEGSTGSGTPLLYLLDRDPQGTWSQTTLRPGPDDGETRPHLVATALTLFAAYGSFESPTDANLLTIPRSTLAVPSPTTLFISGGYSDGALPPRQADGESGLLWLGHDRTDESVTRVWAALPSEVLPDNTDHAHTVTEPEVTQHHQVSVDSATHAHTADVVTVNQDHAVTVHDAAHAHAATAPTVTAAGLIDVDGATHGHTADAVTVTQAHLIAVDSATHGHAVTQPIVADVIRTGIDIGVTIGPMRRLAPSVGAARDEPPATVAAMRDAALAEAGTMRDAALVTAVAAATDATTARATGTARRAWTVGTLRRGWAVGPIRRDR